MRLSISRPTKPVLALLLLAALCGWALYSLLQEAYLEHQLSAQASHVAQQNAALAAQNDGYQRDIVALQSGAAAEEDARLNGYARSDEKVYLIAPEPSPSPRPAPRRR
jgi:cell division protein FtsB